MERLHRRLEGDGWDFVGGRYGEVELQSEMDLKAPGNTFGTCSHLMMRTECIDEEFDVVVVGLEVVEVVEPVGA
jgi:hypothetical protein